MRAGGTGDIPTLYTPRLRRCTAEYTKAGLTESQPFISTRVWRKIGSTKREKRSRGRSLLTAGSALSLNGGFSFRETRRPPFASTKPRYAIE